MPGTLNINQINMTSPNGSLTKSLTLANTGQPQLDGKGFGLLAEYTVTGSAVTSIDFSGLDINTHKSYRVECDLINATASVVIISLFINNDLTATNYYAQEINADASTIVSYRSNVAQISFIRASTQTMTEIIITKNASGYAKSFAFSNADSASTVELDIASHSKSSTVTNITQLTFTASVANSIGVGSTIRIYRGDI